MENDIFEKLKEAKSAEELVEIAKADGAEITAEDAQTLFSQISGGEISDEELEEISGGIVYHNLRPHNKKKRR